MIVVPGAQQAAADQIVDLALVGGEIAALGRGRGGDDGVVVGDLGIVDEAPSQRTLAGAGRQMLAIRRLDRLARSAAACAATSCDRCRLSVRG